MRLVTTDFALPAAIFRSLSNGVQSFKIFSYPKKIWVSYVDNTCSRKNFTMKLELETYIRQLNRFTILQSRALQLQPVLRTITMLSHKSHRREGVVVRASASQSIDPGFISQVESYQKTLKNGIHSRDVEAVIFQQLPLPLQRKNDR